LATLPLNELLRELMLDESRLVFNWRRLDSCRFEAFRLLVRLVTLSLNELLSKLMLEERRLVFNSRRLDSCRFEAFRLLARLATLSLNELLSELMLEERMLVFNSRRLDSCRFEAFRLLASLVMLPLNELLSELMLEDSCKFEAFRLLARLATLPLNELLSELMLEENWDAFDFRRLDSCRLEAFRPLARCVTLSPNELLSEIRLEAAKAWLVSMRFPRRALEVSMFDDKSDTMTILSDKVALIESILYANELLKDEYRFDICMLESAMPPASVSNLLAKEVSISSMLFVKELLKDASLVFKVELTSLILLVRRRLDAFIFSASEDRLKNSALLSEEIDCFSWTLDCWMLEEIVETVMLNSVATL
jgi:hypothetical protein